MEIKIDLLKHYFKVNGFTVAISFSEGNLLKFTLGNHNGSNSVFRTHKDLTDILIANNKTRSSLKDTGATVSILVEKLKNGGDEKIEDDIDFEIYDTLARYIIEMLSASRGKLIYPDLKHLKKDGTYFNGSE